MVLTNGKNKLVPSEKHLKDICELSLCGLLPCSSSEYPPFILWAPGFFKSQWKWNTELAKPHIRSRFCLEKAVGKITHTCMSPEIGKQVSDHREETVHFGGSAGNTETQGKWETQCDPQAPGLPSWVLWTFLAASQYWDENSKRWGVGGLFPLSPARAPIYKNHRTGQTPC